MPSVAPGIGPSTCGDVFEPLVAFAKARVIVLVETRTLARDDGAFLLRALLDLEADGVELFGDMRPADGGFYGDVEAYLNARVGVTSVGALALAPATSAAVIAQADCECRRAAELLGSSDGSPFRSSVERAVLQLINHPEVNT
jgi:hypothetical protein